MDVNLSSQRTKHPKECANILSKITFFYNWKILWETYKTGTFKENQLHDVLSNCKAETSGNELEKCLLKDKMEHKKLSLIRILWKCYGIKYLILGIIQLLMRSVVIITIPMTLSKVVLYFQSGQTELSKETAIIFAFLLVLLNILSVTYMHNYLLILSEFGIRIRTAFCSVIFKKCLRISLSDLSTGKIVTLMTKDVAAIENFIFYFNDTWIGIIQTIIVFYLIYIKMGTSTLVGMGFFIAIMPMQIIVGKITLKLRLKSSKKTDERLQTTKETLSGIRIVKMNNWEKFFEQKITQSRKKEMSSILKIFLAKTANLLIGSLTSKIAFYLLLTSHILMGNTISAELIYYITTLFLRVRHALSVAIPVGVSTFADMTASLNRIEQIMISKEISKQINSVDQKKSQISLLDVSVVINNNKILENINLNVDSGLLIVIGPIGSGKTTILKTILGEYEIQTGSVLKDGVISYASQEPWIFPSTLKQNIIFEEKFDEERYRQVLDICALNFDLLRSGDNIKIEDKGGNLSKGQKARINLARAVYKIADIYLLDDSLTSLDTNVQKHIFQKCIKEFLADKICIFVTQNIQPIEDTEKIVIIDKGKIIFTQNIKYINKIKVLKKEEGLKQFIEIEENIFEETALLKKSNLYEEKIKPGRVNFKVYKKYSDFGGGFLIILIIIIFFAGAQFSKSYTEKFLSHWANTVYKNLTNSKDQLSSDKYLLVYTILIVMTTVLSIIAAFLLFNFSRKSCLGLHKSMIESVLTTSMKFFHEHLIGNILNRFSKDLNIIDEQIPFAIYEVLEICFGILGIVILIAVVNIIFLIPIIIIFVILYLLSKLYLPTGRNLQRLDTATRSPVIGYLTSSLEGLTTIRAFNAENILMEEFDKHQDLYTSANFTSKCCERTFGFYLDLCCTSFIGVIIATFFIFEKESSVGDVGLTITQAFTLTGIVQYGIRKWTEIENKMTSVERILEYIDIEKEIDDPKEVYSGWPNDNTIIFNNVSFAYDSNEEYILRDINLIIGSKEKVGIVGRTGCGKSTLLSLLFHLYPYEGKISLGSIDLRTIPLKSVRSNISIISQDPMLFTGTIRKNLDPTNKNTDEEIWKVIQITQLQNLISTLDLEISESGSNFSAGQRQLICLARCLLTKNKIIILDEATSDMDQESENLIINILEQYFEDCTVLIVAHKLKTVLNCDKIVVIQDGQIAECDEVNKLKKDVNSIFYKLLKNSALIF